MPAAASSSGRTARTGPRNTAAMLADHGIVWFEEPLPPDDLEGYIELTRVSPVPIAGGEVLTRRQAFRPWIERRAVDILQPDCTKNGGLSESRRIAWLAADHNVQVVPHGWNTAVGLAADLQFSAAIPVARYVEYLTPCAYIDELTTEPFRLDAEGHLTIPTAPGLGIEHRPRQAAPLLPGAGRLPVILNRPEDRTSRDLEGPVFVADTWHVAGGGPREAPGFSARIFMSDHEIGPMGSFRNICAGPLPHRRCPRATAIRHVRVVKEPDAGAHRPRIHRIASSGPRLSENRPTAYRCSTSDRRNHHDPSRPPFPSQADDQTIRRAGHLPSS